MKQTGRAEADRLKKALDATFERAKHLPPKELELSSDFARFLCIRVSGYLEKAVAELLTEHARRNGGLNAEKLKTILGSFDPDWRLSIDETLTDGKKEAVDSIVSLRNRIAHGQDVGVTYSRVAGYYREVQRVVEAIASLCAPP